MPGRSLIKCKRNDTWFYFIIYRRCQYLYSVERLDDNVLEGLVRTRPLPDFAVLARRLATGTHRIRCGSAAYLTATFSLAMNNLFGGNSGMVLF
jgi:hypothetical protein